MLLDEVMGEQPDNIVQIDPLPFHSAVHTYTAFNKVWRAICGCGQPSWSFPSSALF